MKDKKAVVEVQFNWILILIIGGLILVFFATIIVKMKDSSDERAHLSILKSMRSIIVGSQSSAGTTSVLTLPNARLEFGCDSLRVGTKGNQFQDMLVFAPRAMESDQLVVKTLSWDIPFRVSNLVFISSPKMQYVLIGNDPLRDEIADMMPDELDVTVMNADTDPAFSNLDTTLPTRLVYFTQSMPPIGARLQQFSSLESSGVWIDVSGSTRDVTFVEKFQSATTQHPTIENEFILGAVYATQASLYGCVLQNAVEKALRVSSVYEDRAQNIEVDPATDASCGLILNDGAGEFNDLRTLFEEYPAGRWSSGNFLNNYQQYSSNLESYNQDASLRSCAYLY